MKLPYAMTRSSPFANYHRSFIKDFAKISGPLYEITGKTKFQWKEPQQQAFDRLKVLINMSSRKANTVFHVKPRRTKFITLAYVPGALHNPKLILTTQQILSHSFYD
jgi:hypothetical protein